MTWLWSLNHYSRILEIQISKPKQSYSGYKMKGGGKNIYYNIAVISHKLIGRHTITNCTVWLLCYLQDGCWVPLSSSAAISTQTVGHVTGVIQWCISYQLIQFLCAQGIIFDNSSVGTLLYILLYCRSSHQNVCFTIESHVMTMNWCFEIENL